MKDLAYLAFEIKDDKSLWERMDVPNVGEVLLVEESYGRKQKN